MATEASLGVTDHVEAAMIDCAPEPVTVDLCVDASASTEPTPIQQIHQATIEQVGADPPPVVTHG